MGTRTGGIGEHGNNFNEVGIFILILIKPKDLRGKDVGGGPMSFRT